MNITGGRHSKKDLISVILGKVYKEKTGVSEAKKGILSITHKKLYPDNRVL